MLAENNHRLMGRLRQTCEHFASIARFHGARRVFDAALMKVRYWALNRSVPQGRIALSREVAFNVDPTVRSVFRAFTDLNVDGVDEMTSFLRLTGSGGCLLDVGSHYGIFSLAFAGRCVDNMAHAIEPSPPAFEVLSRHCALNPSFDIHPAPVAFAAVAGTLEMDYEWTHLVARASAHAPTAPSTTVQATTLDQFVTERSIKPNFVKIDTEGFELAVLKGGDSVLREFKPLIFLEVHPAQLKRLGSSVGELVDYLDCLGYGLLDLAGREIRYPKSFFTEPVHRVVCRARSASAGTPRPRERS